MLSHFIVFARRCRRRRPPRAPNTAAERCRRFISRPPSFRETRSFLCVMRKSLRPVDKSRRAAPFFPASADRALNQTIPSSTRSHGSRLFSERETDISPSRDAMHRQHAGYIVYADADRLRSSPICCRSSASACATALCVISRHVATLFEAGYVFLRAILPFSDSRRGVIMR